MRSRRIGGPAATVVGARLRCGGRIVILCLRAVRGVLLQGLACAEARHYCGNGVLG
jgi:hypothetical protein